MSRIERFICNFGKPPRTPRPVYLAEANLMNQLDPITAEKIDFGQEGPTPNPYTISSEMRMSRLYAVSSTDVNYEFWNCEWMIPYADTSCIIEDHQLVRIRHVSNGLICEYFQTTALFEMLCQQSESFPEVIDPKYRMFNTLGASPSCADPAKLNHLLDSRLTALTNLRPNPDTPNEFLKVIHSKLCEYINFCSISIPSGLFRNEFREIFHSRMKFFLHYLLEKTQKGFDPENLLTRVRILMSTYHMPSLPMVPKLSNRVRSVAIASTLPIGAYIRPLSMKDQHSIYLKSHLRFVYHIRVLSTNRQNRYKGLFDHRLGTAVHRWFSHDESTAIHIPSHAERNLRSGLSGDVDILKPRISLLPGIFATDKTVTRPRKRLYREMIEGVSESPFLFQPDCFMFD